MNQMVNNNKNKNSSNSLVFGQWPRTKIFLVQIALIEAIAQYLVLAVVIAYFP